MVGFKVGDIVRAKKREDGDEYYGVTTSHVRCKVVAVNYVFWSKPDDLESISMLGRQRSK